MPLRTIPASLEPMYASVGTGVPAGDDWTFEPKYDGVRVLAHVSKRSVKLMTRNGLDKAAGFPEIVAALRVLVERIGRVVVLDGEIVALHEGRPARFQALQGRMHVTDAARLALRTVDTPVTFIAFDILRDGDQVLLGAPWRDRRAHLEAVFKEASRGSLPEAIRLGDTQQGDGATLLARARRDGWEGIIAKRTGARYLPGDRSDDWRKLKVEFRQEFVVGGWTEPRNTREHIGALLLGHYDGDRFVYVGHTGGGFTREGLAAMYRKLAPLERKTSPFETPPRTNEPAHWTTPRVVVEVKFAEWTADDRLRQPIYLGTRDDKNARDVGREKASVQ